MPAPAPPVLKSRAALAERARTLASLGQIGSLSTHSRKFPGFPFGSMMPYAVDERGRPVFFISSMAMHTQNLLQDPRASLLITQPDVSGERLDAARVTLIGTAAEVPAAEVRALYLSRHENAKLWQDFTDFAYYRLEITGVYFVGGFGVVAWIAAKDYESARPDPFVDAAAGIIQHMNADEAGKARLNPASSVYSPSPHGLLHKTIDRVVHFGLYFASTGGYDIAQDGLRRESQTCRGAPSGRSCLLAGDEGIKPAEANAPSFRI